MNRQKNIIIGISSVFLLLASLNGWPYDFFVLLRFIVCISAIYLAWLAYKTKQEKWIWAYGIIAMLFNPIFPLHFGRSAWVVIDIATAIFLITSSFLFQLSKRKKVISTKDDMDFSDKTVFNYDDYFDIPEGENQSGFKQNEYKFNPYFEDYLIDKIDNISNKKIRLNFSFLGSKGKNSIVNGENVHFDMMAYYVGKILCSDVISIEKEKVNNKSITFTIAKEFESGNKIISIQNSKVGKVTIKCNKLYAEKLDCYFKYADGWRKEKSQS